MGFYAVANGRTIGVLTNWNDCKAAVYGFSKPIYKKFDTNDAALDFIRLHTRDKEEIVPDYYVYTDGACSKNGRKGAVAGLGIFFGVGDSRNVSRAVEGKQTNNTAELSAIMQTYPIIEADIMKGKRVTIVSDSEYAIRCVTTYGEKCSRKGWAVDIPNKEMVRKAYEMYKGAVGVRFMHVMAHTGGANVHAVGNDWADKLARESSHL